MLTYNIEKDRMRVLLVGASGRVGQMVLHHWKSDPAAISIMPQFRKFRTFGSLLWDPLEGARPLVDEVKSSGNFEAMVMLAGVVPGNGRKLDTNLELAKACLNAASRAGIKRVLLASSSAVYGVGDGTPLTEYSPCNPVNEYGTAKLAMEEACAAWIGTGMDLCVLRIGNVAGADALLVNVAKSAPQKPIEIDIFSDGHGPKRSYIGPQTMAKVLQSLCRHSSALPPVLNVAVPIPLSMDALADAADHPWLRRAPSEKSYQNIILDCSALASLHAFESQDTRPEEMVRQWKDAISS